MPSTVTHSFRQYVADQFVESLAEGVPSVFHIGIGRSLPWPNELVPPTPTDGITSTAYNTWRQLLAVKRVQPSDVTYCVPRVNWVSGVVYDQYDDMDPNLYTKSFYVLTDEYNLYKVIDNAGGVASTVKPTGTSTSLLKTLDGYVWKYMSTLTAPEVVKWLSTTHIPVKTLTADDGSAQWDVQSSAVDGSVVNVRVLTQGGGYKSQSGNVQSASLNALVIANTADPAIGTYTGSSVFISSGTGAGQLRRIASYSGSPTYTVGITPSWTIVPDPTSTYLISPSVNVVGDGTGASAYVSSITPSGNVQGVTIVSSGSGYSNTSITITANTSHGAGATARSVQSPPGGHGSNPVVELGGTNVMINVQLSGGEGGSFTANNDFRTITLHQDIRYANNVVVTSPVVSNLASVDVTSRVGSFTQDEIIVGTVSGAMATVVDVLNTGNTIRTLPFTTTAPSIGEVITGQVSGATAVVSAVAESGLKQGSGRVLYIDNRVAVQRSGDQIEDIRHVISF